MIPNNFKLIFEAITGSNLYGTSTEESDMDIRGVFIPSKEYFYGFLNTISLKDYEDKENDKAYYDIRSFMKLLLANNPTVLEFLFIPKKLWRVRSKEWIEIVSVRDSIVSKLCADTFIGYANEQLKRIKRHRSWLLNPPKEYPTREKYGLPSNHSLIPKDQIGAFNKLLSLYLQQIGKFHELREQLESMEEFVSFISLTQNLKEPDYEAIKILMPISDNFIEALDKEKAYMNAMREWKSYQNWKNNRNPARAKLEEKFGYDLKHATHLYRLLSEGDEVLSDGNITFPRPDVEILRYILSGNISYDELISITNDQTNELKELKKHSFLIEKPDKELLDKLCILIVSSYLTKEVNK